jgi:hypothetical protein
MLCKFDITFDIKNKSEIRNFPQVPVATGTLVESRENEDTDPFRPARIR